MSIEGMKRLGNKHGRMVIEFGYPSAVYAMFMGNNLRNTMTKTTIQEQAEESIRQLTKGEIAKVLDRIEKVSHKDDKESGLYIFSEDIDAEIESIRKECGI